MDSTLEMMCQKRSTQLQAGGASAPILPSPLDSLKPSLPLRTSQEQGGSPLARIVFREYLGEFLSRLIQLPWRPGHRDLTSSIRLRLRNQGRVLLAIVLSAPFAAPGINQSTWDWQKCSALPKSRMWNSESKRSMCLICRSLTLVMSSADSIRRE